MHATPKKNTGGREPEAIRERPNNLKYEFTSLQDLNKAPLGSSVWIRAEVHTVGIRRKECFIVLRQGEFTSLVNMPESEFSSIIFQGSIVEVEAKVTEVGTTIAGFPQQNVELVALEIYVVSSSNPQMSLLMENVDMSKEKDMQKKVPSPVLPKTSKFRKYVKRTETVDSGKEYEKLLSAFYALTLSINDDVQNFEMTSNNKDCGDFDDLEFLITLKNGRNKRFMFQIKHKDNVKVLKKEDFKMNKNYLLKKYFQSIPGLQDDDVTYILFTNNKVNLENNSVISDGIAFEHCSDLEYKDILLGTKISVDNIYQFKSAEKKFYLFAQQDNVRTVEFKLKKMLANLLQCDIYGTLTYYMNKWWSQNYVLTKHDFIAKLTELAFSPFIKSLSNEKINPKTEYLKEEIMKFEMTLVENGDIVNSIWDIEETSDFGDCAKNFALTKTDTSKLLWFLDKVPLVVKVENTHESTVRAVLKLLKKDLRQKKIILIGKMPREHFDDWDIFENVSDLMAKGIHNPITNTCKVSLQGRGAVLLKQLLGVDEEISTHIKTQQLFEMSQKDYLIGEPGEQLPKFHVPRSVEQSAHVIEEKNIFHHFKDKLNVFCAPPGMGKSTLLRSLNNSCPSESWTIFVRLINCNCFFTTDRHFDPETLLKLEGAKGNDALTTKVKEMLIKHKLVEIFLDGLDEVDSKHVPLVIKFVQHLTENGFKVWLTSRENLQEKLRETLEVLPIEIKELTKEEQTQYIHDKLAGKFNEEEIKNVVTSVFASVDIANSRKLLGIPLQLYILTEILLHNNGVEEKNMFVLTRMYKLFFSGKKRFKFSKLGIDESLESQLGMNFERDLEQYENPGLMMCLDSDDYAKLGLTTSESEGFLTGLQTNGDKYGIITRVFRSFSFDFHPIFMHQTFAEYFACVWLAKNKEKLVVLEDTFFSRKYDNLRRFFDIMMAEQNSLHLAVIYGNVEKISTDVETKFHEVDEGGRTALHVACTYGNSSNLFPKKIDHFWLERGSSSALEVIDLLAGKGGNLYQQDNLFRFDCFDYSIKRGCLQLLEKCFADNLLTCDQILKIRDDKKISCTHMPLYCAGFGHCNLFSLFMHQNPDLARATTRLSPYFFQQNVLHIAIRGCRNDDYSKERKGNVVVVQKIIENIKDMNSVYQNDKDGNLNPLDYACYYGCYDMFETLIQNGAKCSGGNSILHQLASGKARIALKRIKQFGIPIDGTNDKGETALHLACVKSNFENLQILTNSRSNINGVDNRKNSALHKAMEANREEVMITQLLITNGVSINARNDDGKTALHLAASKDFVKSASYLLENSADATIVDNHQNTPLHCMRYFNDPVEMTKLLVTNGVNVNAQNDKGVTALHLATKNCTESFKYLMLNDANLEARDRQGNTLYHFAVKFCEEFGGFRKQQRYGILKILADKGFDPNCPNHQGMTPAHLACKIGSSSKLEYCRNHRADFRILDNAGNSALHFALQSKHQNFQTIDFLLEQEINIDARNKSGQTPLHLGCEIGVFINVKYLCEKNADITISDNEQQNVICYARKNAKKFFDSSEQKKMLDYFKSRGLEIVL